MLKGKRLEKLQDVRKAYVRPRRRFISPSGRLPADVPTGRQQSITRQHLVPHPCRATVKRRSPQSWRGVRSGRIFVILAPAEEFARYRRYYVQFDREWRCLRSRQQAELRNNKGSLSRCQQGHFRLPLLRLYTTLKYAPPAPLILPLLPRCSPLLP